MAASHRDTSTVQGLERGLDVLTFLNLRYEATVADVADGACLHRTTAARTLETLRRRGFLDRDPVSRKYRLTIKVRQLADGYDDEAWISQIARPRVKVLSSDVVWPIYVATPSGSSMVWRVNTDHDSPLALQRYSSGLQVPIWGSSIGAVYLGYCTLAERATVTELIADAPVTLHAPPFTQQAVDQLVGEVRSQGYSMVLRHGSGEGGLSTPILDGQRYLASLGMRFNISMSQEAILGKYLPTLQKAATDIGAQFAGRAVQTIWRKSG